MANPIEELENLGVLAVLCVLAVLGFVAYQKVKTSGVGNVTDAMQGAGDWLSGLFGGKNGDSDSKVWLAPEAPDPTPEQTAQVEGAIADYEQQTGPDGESLTDELWGLKLF